MTDERIREAIDDIKPEEGARERMLANIRRKAAEQAAESVSSEPAAAETVTSTPEKAKVTGLSSVLRTYVPIAAGVILIAAVGLLITRFINTRPAEPTAPTDIIVNPFNEVGSAAELEKQLGISIDAPSGSSEVTYVIIDDKIAEVNFMNNGNFYSLRTSKISGDFSGLNGTEIKSEQIDSGKNAILSIIKCEDEKYVKVTWTDGKINYVLSNTDGASESDMKSLYEKIK